VKIHLHSPTTPSLRGAQLKRHMDNFTFTLTFIYTEIWELKQQALIETRTSAWTVNFKKYEVQNVSWLWCIKLSPKTRSLHMKFHHRMHSLFF
jgi:hypothetical protein